MPRCPLRPLLLHFSPSITGMSIADQFSKHCDGTILGKFLPGDPMDQRYIS